MCSLLFGHIYIFTGCKHILSCIWKRWSIEDAFYVLSVGFIWTCTSTCKYEIELVTQIIDHITFWRHHFLFIFYLFKFRPFIFVWRHQFFFQTENHVSVSLLSSLAPFLREISFLQKKCRFFARSIFLGNQTFFLEKKFCSLNFFLLRIRHP